MSNTLRYDALLLRALAAELEERLRGARVARAWLEKAERRLTLLLGERRAPRTLSWSLHPQQGQLALREGAAASRGAQLQVQPGSRITRVHALPDERVLRLELDAGEASPGVVRALVVELVGQRWNALALGRDDVISATMVQRSDTTRELRAGVAWACPPGSARAGVEAVPDVEEWLGVLRETPPELRARALLARFAYTSPINIQYIVGEAGLRDTGEHVLRESHTRYVALRTSAPWPCVLPGGQPYVHTLGTQATEVSSLLDAIAASSEVSALPALGEDALREQVRVRLYERAERLRARAARLESERTAAEAEATALRTEADVLMARMHQIERGSSEVEVEDFEGRLRRIMLDPELNAQQNAEQRYDQARRRERAAEHMPVLQSRVEHDAQQVQQLRRRLEAGELSAEELRDLGRSAERAAQRASLPYRRYRTSSGLEVRVGRNSRANDALTAQHASPDDVWMHARDVGGAHVVLRWGRREGNPPHQDLEEAAMLAALHSRSRTSGVVAVDWTRRKYVRKPRKAPPGLVIPERVQTLFVEPSRAVEQKLRDEEDSD